MDLLAERNPMDKGFRGYKETTDLLKFLNHVWDIWNVRKSGLDVRYKLPHMAVFKQPHDSRFLFFDKFGEWLKDFETMATSRKRRSKKCFTVDTWKATVRTNRAIVEVIRSLLTELGASYVLPAKITNDPIEGTFRNYRQMAGATYLVTVREILEGQTRLRINGYLRAHWVPFGTTKFSLSQLQHSETGDYDVDKVMEFYWDRIAGELPAPEPVDPKVVPVFTLICGYCAFKIGRKQSCSECAACLKTSKEMLFELDSKFDVRQRLRTYRQTRSRSFVLS